MNVKIIKLFKSPFFIFLIASIIPFAIAVGSIYSGRIAFWFDPARDLSLALKNLSHPTLVGQPSGIPGVLYPPYWIWFISVILMFSKNPQIVSFFVLTVPYFTLFPFFLYKIVGKWGTLIFGALWFLFITNFVGYSTQIWNVNLFPLFLIISIYFTLEYHTARKNRIEIIFAFLSGFFLGLASTFHLSLGIPVILGMISFNLILLIPKTKLSNLKLKNSLINFGLFLFGLFLIYTPSLLFEARHSFLQTKIFLNALTSTALHHTAVVGLKGLTDIEIIQHFFGRIEILLSIPMIIAYLFILFILIELVIKYSKNKIVVEAFEKRMILLSILISTWVLFIFLRNSNPVWNYYFIGLEIFFLLILGFLANKTILGKAFLLIAVIITLFNSLSELNNNLKKNDFTVTDLATEEHMVNLIKNDASNDFYYYAYNPAIYTYEYDYLFKLMSAEKLNINSKTIYLIIPKTSNPIKEDFIHYRAPENSFKKINEWTVPDRTTIYKMQRIK